VKQKLEETTSAKIQKMIAQRLNEIHDEEIEEAFDGAEDKEQIEEEFDFSSFLEEDETEDDLAGDDSEVPATGDQFGTDAEGSADIDPAADGEFGMEDDATEGDDTPVSSMTKGELMALIQDAIAGGTDDMAPEGDLDSGIEDTEMSDLDSPETVGDASGDEFGAGEEDEDINIDELLAEIDAQYKGGTSTVTENKKLKAELKEAYKTIDTVGKKLQEINLLNSKLLYTNRLLKDKSLNESQKVSVIQNIDKATSPKEAKVIFETIEKMFSTPVAKPGKAAIKESLGSSSKGTGKVARPNVQSDDFINRLQVMAGIKKSNS